MPIDSFTGDYRWLSNFQFADVTLDGVVYPSVEHAYQAAKTDDAEIRAAIRAGTAAAAKRIGRGLRPPGWTERSLAVMEGLLRQKFARADLRAKLLATGDEELIEGNWWNDTFWGVFRGKGHNHLGKILMRIRQDLRAATE